MANLVKEMERLKVNILGISETRWTDAGTFTSGEYTVIFSGGTTHERGVAVLLDKVTSRSLIGHWGVSDRVVLVKLAAKPFNLAIIQVYAPTADSDENDIAVFYEDLEKAMKQCKSDEITMVVGDLNAKVGEGRVGDTVGPHGLGARNERGDRWIEWCNEQDLMIANTWFMQPPRRKYTWLSPGDRVRNQIDFITIKKRFRNAVKEAKTYPGADISSDHVPVISQIHLQLKKIRKQTGAKKLDFAALKEDSNIRDMYKLKVSNRFEVLEDEDFPRVDRGNCKRSDSTKEKAK
ncbi:craniofacial development protein 2-like [Amphiura filiformis]|uniref:craniofacial development protein 2-like n=1 Tax=Amphiura filiformis TaxID=82378 RepID=UPI003B20D83D